MAAILSQISSLIEQDRACVWHPWTQMKTAPSPIPIVRGQGIYLYAEDGSRYIDAVSSWWVNLHGHAHPYIVEKIKAQAEVQPLISLADQLSALKGTGEGALRAYVRNVCLGLFGNAQQVVVETKQ